MARGKRYQSQLNNARQSSGMRQLVICCIVSVLLLTFYVREGEGGPIHMARAGVSAVTTPVRLLGSAIAAPFGAVGNAVSNLTASPETLSDLKRENEELTARVAELAEAQATAERLQALVDLQSTYKLESKAARIIGASADAWSQTVTLDKGSADGFAAGMPVCNAAGVIGQIVEVSPTSSTVRLITDEQSGVSAMVQSSRAQGMLQGQADGTLRLSYVPSDAEVAEGDIVITSGLGGVFPKGLPLGTVTSVERIAGSAYHTIVVRPQASAESNEEVLVVTSLTEEQVASDDDVRSANARPSGGEEPKDEDGAKDAAADEGGDDGAEGAEGTGEE